MNGEKFRALLTEWERAYGEYGARIGCSVLEPSGRVIWEQDNHKWFVPASNQKLWTTGVALDRLGPTFQWETHFSWEEEACWIRGGGDPGFDLVQSAAVAEVMKRAGLKRIRRFYIDCSINPDPVWGPGWMWDDLDEGFTAPVSSLVMEGNRIRFFAEPGGDSPIWKWEPAQADVQVNADVTWDGDDPTDIVVRRKKHRNHFFLQGTLSPQEPEVEGAVASAPRFFVEMFSHSCREAGIQVDRFPLIDFAPYRSGEAVWIQPSQPLATLLTRVNGDSDNLTAEILLRTLGRDDTGTFSQERGLELLSRYWSEQGVKPPSRQVDGSGLSSHNAATPYALATWMNRMLARPHRQVWIDSLARYGISGTLKDRPLPQVPLTIAAKTGSLTGVRTLTGYLLQSGLPVLIFSLLINGLAEDEHGELLQDRFIDLLCRWR
ncbi:D-alanyl-D-alanine carboxypeptidase/D-alanyl-D-alanine endopeptidase [Desmospora activa]|uniref:D-alanyl-D-alanine carboxypeptidase/D-alanyl-D-alanine-endopeptidase (Penicillin-binding protein 4) n=1 Tax=Desmospora activa DSM 45169 TaxID=1121389 RepID=A0A2T4ZC14_9BACL|nr:D-alanyl-D-alanine carboxypeptidase/D-alanyl-D-alanine-endopeptidase [Desmospora activa]PTM59427.1 D-alanyl-D-alanine carboxypeptidase/D-alanyl-D-alanine-endopeptidase (penicillin-binding protein 4) [Desmospora activa DSM 45169]